VIAQTGIGSYIVVGNQPSISLISDTIVAAREGEQMKWRVVDLASLVPLRSWGVMRIRGVRYPKLKIGIHSTKFKSHKEIEPSVVALVRIERTSSTTVRLIPKCPHRRTIFF
jgi:hypothetical protein